MIVYPACLDCPWITYIGAREKEKRVYREWRSIKCRYPHVLFFPYPCPEFMHAGWPRVPSGREEYADMDLEKIVEFVVRVVREEGPDRLAVLGIRGSPTCGVRETTVGKSEGLQEEEFRRAGPEERVRMREKVRGLKRERGAGVFMEALMERLEADYLEVDKDSRHPFHEVEAWLTSTERDSP